MTTTTGRADLRELLDRRHSCRGFLPLEVPEATVREMFALAQRTPSWCNTQPWKVHLLGRKATTRFAAALTEHVAAGNPESPDLPAPGGYSGSYGDRRREAGYALYRSLGIGRADRARRAEQLMENFRFFGAPHTAVITTDREIGVYGAVDCGAYVATLLLAAQALGVAAIPQAAVAMYSALVRDHLALGSDRLVVCAVSFGFADPDHPANGFRTTRADPADVVHIVEGDDR